MPPTSSVAASMARADAFALSIRVSIIRVSFAFHLRPLQRRGESAYNPVLPAQLRIDVGEPLIVGCSAVPQE
jgi:hypothetical protein